ncbi:hypothetical protein R1flu_008172 [Riccia fluitans]|uniref:Uncharacterized protein n=1 Tax=Riccia fluitans TaxID=41844 RepID=A0ABD1YEH0_9MARC
MPSCKGTVLCVNLVSGAQDSAYGIRYYDHRVLQMVYPEIAGAGRVPEGQTCDCVLHEENESADPEWSVREAVESVSLQCPLIQGIWTCKMAAFLQTAILFIQGRSAFHSCLANR